MKKAGVLVVAALMLWAFAGYGASTSFAQGAGTPLTIPMNEQNGSGESGTATLVEQDGKLTVTIELANGTTTAQPAHIHRGTCSNLDPSPAIPLSSVVDGKSTTTIDLTTNTVVKSLGELSTGSYAINVHKSAAEVSTYVACGDFLPVQTGPAPGPGTGTGTETGGTVSTPGMPSTGGGNEIAVLVALALLALSLTATGFRIRLAARKG